MRRFTFVIACRGEDEIQSPTPGSNNVREYTIEHTPELGEEPSQKKKAAKGIPKGNQLRCLI